MEKKICNKKYVINYNDGEFAESITFVNYNEEDIEPYLEKVIEKYNKIKCSEYHISRKNIHLEE